MFEEVKKPSAAPPPFAPPPVPAVKPAIPEPAAVAKPALGPVAAPAPGPAAQGPNPQNPTAAPVDPAKEREAVTHGMEVLREGKTIIRPDQKGPEVELLQKQLRQMGLHIPVTGVYDKATAGYIKALQTGGGLGSDGIVGPKTIEQLLKLDVGNAPKPDDPAHGDKEDKVDHIPDDPKLAAIYLYNQMRLKNAKEDLSDQQKDDLAKFVKNWEANKARYEAVAAKAGVPAKLIASLHWRESTGNFGTYLHQGDPLGKKAVHEPSDIPIFKTWEPAAEHALGQKSGIKKSYKIDENTTDETALASYAERYNGIGYHNYHAMASPYVFSGTDQYKKGKYTSDGHFDNNHKDSQLGVVEMMRAIDKSDADAAAKALAAKKAAAAATPPAGAQDQEPGPHPAQHFAD